MFMLVCGVQARPPFASVLSIGCSACQLSGTLRAQTFVFVFSLSLVCIDVKRQKCISADRTSKPRVIVQDRQTHTHMHIHT